MKQVKYRKSWDDTAGKGVAFSAEGVRVSLRRKVTSELRWKMRWTGCAKILRNCMADRGHSECKGPEAGRAWVMEEQRGGLCGWSRRSEGDRGRRRQGGDRQVVQGPVGCREDLGFDPEGGGSHGGLWAGEGGPGSWALTGAPWLLWEDRLWGWSRGSERGH
jgi:hypothetical protein